MKIDAIRYKTKQKMSESMKGVKKITKECPYCGLIGGAPQMAQWHFNNCKQKNI